jgi:O-antigen ligase
MNPLHLAAWVAACLLSSTLFAHTVALRLLLLLAGIGLLAVAIARDRHSLRLLPPLWIPLVLWALWSVASLAWSIDVGRTGKELRNEIGYSVAVFWLCFVAAQARAAPRIFLPIVGLAAAAVSMLALYDFLARGWYEYILGLHGGPGNHSSALVILLPCSAAAVWHGHQAKWPLWARIAGWSLIALLALSAYATLNRTIWVALALQMVLLVVFALRRGTRAAPRGALIILTLAGTLALATGLLLQKITSERMVTGSSGKLDSDPRLALWGEALERIEERPLTGYGFGRGLLRDTLRAEFNKAELWHAHNLFLDAALQTGIPGALLLAALFVSALWQGWRLARGAGSLAAACGMALALAVLGTVVRNMTDVLWVRQNAVLYWGVVGVLLAWGARPRTGN